MVAKRPVDDAANAARKRSSCDRRRHPQTSRTSTRRYGQSLVIGTYCFRASFNSATSVGFAVGEAGHARPWKQLPVHGGQRGDDSSVARIGSLRDTTTEVARLTVGLNKLKRMRDPRKVTAVCLSSPEPASTRTRGKHPFECPVASSPARGARPGCLEQIVVDIGRQRVLEVHHLHAVAKVVARGFPARGRLLRSNRRGGRLASARWVERRFGSRSPHLSTVDDHHHCPHVEQFRRDL